MITNIYTKNIFADKQNGNINPNPSESTNSLIDMEKDFSFLIEQIEEYAIFFLDTEGNIKSWNLGAEHIKGYTREEALNQNISMFYMPEDRVANKSKAILKSAIKNDKYEEEGWRVRKDGNKFWALILITAIYDKNKTHIGFFKITRDLTEKNRTEKELRESLQNISNLTRKNRDWEDFAYIASHDLKEPLRGFNMHLDILNEELQGIIAPNHQAILAVLKKLTLRMNNLLASLLTIARSGVLSGSLTTASLNNIIEDSKRNLLAKIAENKVEIRIPRPLPDIYGDYSQMVSLFQNLIVNAIKYNDKEKKWIEISYKEIENSSLKPAGRNQGLIFYVKDNGCGIDEKYHQLIFEVFKRVPISGSESSGTGIGLYIVKKIIERHNGRIWVESMPGVGSTFYFTLNEHYE